MNKMKTTMEYFNKNLDELLMTNEKGYTEEETLILKDGLKAIFCDDEQECNETLNDYKKQFPKLECKHILKTINERYVIVLV